MAAEDAADCGGGDMVAELEQFTLDAALAPAAYSTAASSTGNVRGWARPNDGVA